MRGILLDQRVRSDIVHAQLADADAELSAARDQILSLRADLAASTALSSPDEVGVVTKIFDATWTKAAWIEVIGSAVAHVKVIAYTFDLEDIRRALKSAALRGCDVQMVVDETASYGKATKSQHSALEDLAVNGVRVYTRKGARADDACGSNDRKSAAPRTGLCHAKVLMNEAECIIGSCNFTNSSQRNFEVACRVQLSAVGCDVAHRMFENALRHAETLNDWVRAGARRNAAAVDEELQPCSLARDLQLAACPSD